MRAAARSPPKTAGTTPASNARDTKPGWPGYVDVEACRVKALACIRAGTVAVIMSRAIRGPGTVSKRTPRISLDPTFLCNDAMRIGAASGLLFGLLFQQFDQIVGQPKPGVPQLFQPRDQ